MTLKKGSPLFQGFEVTVFALIISFIGYYIDAKDPLLVHYSFSFMVLWLAIVTLFYGLAMGLVMWIVFGAFASIIYVDDPLFISILLENLFFVFLYGLFFANLHSRIDKLTIRTNYLQLRLKELTNAFFTLKISHDKLESIYITQPASFRFVISEVLENWTEDQTLEHSADNTLKVLEKFFSVKSATIWKVKNESLHYELASLGHIEKQINPLDPLIQEALLLRRAIYLKDLEDKEQTSYIYAVPFLDKRDKVVSILIIKDIPFMFYHEDTLLKINVVYTYIWTEYKKRVSLNEIHQNQKEELTLRKHLVRQDVVDFKLEVSRLSTILKDFNIESRIYSVSTKNFYLHESITDYFYQSEVLEVLDQYISIQCGNRYLHLVLFPFVSKSGVFQPAKDFDNALRDIENQIKMQAIDEGLKHYINNTPLNSKHVSVQNFNELLKEYGCHD
ncbi:hypothetical protein KKC13_10770 [bacterium]|nr:hypothetical protein [bacterium]MBU1958223.1 hypothetical protein [bacterium]